MTCPHRYFQVIGPATGPPFAQCCECEQPMPWVTVTLLNGGQLLVEVDVVAMPSDVEFAGVTLH